jgi:hypothetical protein
MKVRSEDYDLILAALFIAANEKSLTPDQRERVNKLSHHFRQLADDALREEEIRREQRCPLRLRCRFLQ